MNKETATDDHGRVVKRKPIALSWVWFFPVLAVAVASWFFWDNWKSNGPKIEIQFTEAPGIIANKTLLFYRGVVAGKVIDVRLDEQLNQAVVTVRLKSFAVPLSQAGTIYWIDQPVINLVKTSGLSSLIQGNSIQARLGDGPNVSHFVGMQKMPLHPLESPGLTLKLTAKNISSIEEGAPITYRGVPIGDVMRTGIDQKGTPYAIIEIETTYKSLVRTNSRFWNLMDASLQFGADGVSVNMLNLKGVFLGTIAVDCFDTPGEEAKSGSEFFLSANESLARAEDEGMNIIVHAKEIPTIGINSPVIYHGIIVGSVKQKALDNNNEPELVLFIKKEYVTSVRKNAKFWRVPATSVQAGPGVLKVDIASLQSLIAGGIAYDDFSNQESPLAAEGTSFELFSSEQMARLNSQPLKLIFDDGQGLLPGQTQVRYLGIPVGLVQNVVAVDKHIEVTALLDPHYNFLRQPEMIYTIIRPRISLHGVSGLETLVSGIYIDCNPAPQVKKPLKHFFNKLFGSTKKT